MKLTLTDVLNMPSPEEPATLTYFMRARNGDLYELAVKTDGATDAEAYIKLSTIRAKMAQTSGPPMVVDPPNGSSVKKFTVKSQPYIAILELLSECVSDPAFSPEEWAITGKKFNGQALDDACGFVMLVNGLLPEQMNEEVAREAKKSPTRRKTPTPKRS